jgi:hypothetical protein
LKAQTDAHANGDVDKKSAIQTKTKMAPKELVRGRLQSFQHCCFCD